MDELLAGGKIFVLYHVGDDKWDDNQKEKFYFSMNTKWNGHQYFLEMFTGLIQSSFVLLMEEAASHVNFHLPTQHSYQVGNLLDNILTKQGPKLCAA